MEGLNRPILDNTYRLEPKECDRFYPSKVRECIEEIVTKYLADKETYEHKQAKELAEKLADEIRTAVKQLSIPAYKIVVQTVIGQLNGQGVRVASKCLWDQENDNYASFTYTNSALFCTGIVFGIYYE